MQAYLTDTITLDLRGIGVREIQVELWNERRVDIRNLMVPYASVCAGTSWAAIAGFSKQYAVGKTADFVEQVLLFAVPRIAEMQLPDLLAQGNTPPFKDRLWTVQLDGDDDVDAKQNAAGETYEQRGRLCFEDLCRIVYELWKNPLQEHKQLLLRELRANRTKRRMYEDREWTQAARFAEARNYVRGRYIRGCLDYCAVEVGAMQSLEELLSGASLGVLPEIPAKIEIGKGLSFLAGVLRDAIERDCKEVNEAAKAGPAKSVLVMCGSIVEAILHHRLSSNEPTAQAAATTLAAQASDPALKGTLTNASKTNLDRWNAYELILVAEEMEVVGADATAFAHVLRDYRNLIHAGKAARSSKSVDQYTAGIAIQVVNLVIRDVR